MNKVLIALLAILGALTVGLAFSIKALIDKVRYQKDLEKMNAQLKNKIDVINTVDKNLEELEKNAREKKSKIKNAGIDSVVSNSTDILRK